MTNGALNLLRDISHKENSLLRDDSLEDVKRAFDLLENEREFLSKDEYIKAIQEEIESRR